MEEEQGSVEVPTKVTEPLLNVPHPRALQQTVSPVPGQSKYKELLNVVEELDHEINNSTMFHTLDNFDTESSADSVEWCPIDPFKDIFVCATYQLAKDAKFKSKNSTTLNRGKIYMFQVRTNGCLALLQQIDDVPAVTDMKWSRVKCHDKILLGVVNCAAWILIYELKTNDKKHLQLLRGENVGRTNDNCVTLSLDWFVCRSTNKQQAVVSDSKGYITVFDVYENKLERNRRFLAHEFEAWIACFDYWNECVIYTGGDDCKLICHDSRRAMPIVLDRIHGAGVTSLHSNVTQEFLLSSGSYDENLRLWDTRKMKQPISETDLGGGIWRLKWDPFGQKYLLAACMYGGFKVINCENPETPFIIAEYNEHKSIAYGCDWCFLNSKEISEQIIETESQNICLISTCSFYDHALKLWSFNLKN